MSDLTERVSYLEGLARGMNMDDRDAQNRIWMGIISVLSDVAREVESIQREQGRLETYVGDMDEDLLELESSVLGAPDEFQCTICGHPVIPDDEDTLELICPECGDPMWEPEDNLDMTTETAETSRPSPEPE